MFDQISPEQARAAEPTIWDEILVDPTVPFDPEALAMTVRDQQLWSRRLLYPVARVVSRLIVGVIVVVKRLLPFRISAHGTMDRLCVWFLERFVAPEAATMLVRHFVIETNLLNFIVRNGCPGALPEVRLVPTTLPELGNRAVIEHDLNMYKVLIGVGRRQRWGNGAPLGSQQLDTSMLRVPAIDVQPERRRFLRLDIQTALCFMNIPFALCLTSAEYRRAVHSLRLDESLLAVLSMITGDPTFRAWRPGGGLVRVDSTLDVPRAVYDHAVICEYAHGQLLALAGARARPRPLLIGA